MTKPALHLLCRLGRHDPAPRVRWNEGYYFTRCRRCGADLIRTAYGRWQVPNGFRIVWASKRPTSVETVAIHREQSAGRTPSAVSAPPPVRPVTFVPDFMDDEEADTSWQQHLPPPVEEEQQAQQEPIASADTGGPAAAILVESRPSRGYAAFAIAGIVLIAMLVVMLFQDAGTSESASSLPAGPRFVSEDTSCRAAPSPDAPHLGYLIRGDAVRPGARRGDWVAIRYAGEQCWVPLSLLSAKPVS